MLFDLSNCQTGRDALASGDPDSAPLRHFARSELCYQVECAPLCHLRRLGYHDGGCDRTRQDQLNHGR